MATLANKGRQEKRFNKSFFLFFALIYRFLAPEMFENTPYTAAIDVWGLGMVAARCLSGLRFSDSIYITWFKDGDACDQGDEPHKLDL